MSLPTFVRPALLACAALSPLPAFAHPGHDGGHDGGLTWDFIGEVLHRLSSPYHMAPALIAGAIAVFVWRKMRAKAKSTGRE